MLALTAGAYISDLKSLFGRLTQLIRFTKMIYEITFIISASINVRCLLLPIISAPNEYWSRRTFQAIYPCGRYHFALKYPYSFFCVWIVNGKAEEKKSLESHFSSFIGNYFSKTVKNFLFKIIFHSIYSSRFFVKLFM